MARETGCPGYVYVLHWQPGITRHAYHYVGWSEDVEARLQQHLTGAGSPLVAAAVERGAAVELAETFAGTRADERKIKRQKHTPRRCPLCQESQ